MKLLALTVATAAALTFACPQTAQVHAQSRDDGAVGRPLRLDGGPSPPSDNQGSRSEAAEPAAGTSSTKSQTGIENTGETPEARGRSKTHVGWRSRPRHRFAINRRSHHVFALHVPRHRFFFR